MKSWSFLGLTLLLGLLSCAPPDQRFENTFSRRFNLLENLRTGLCKTWGHYGGTLMLDHWNWPDLDPSNLHHYSDILRAIGATQISVDRNCSTWVGLWQGPVFDFTQRKFIRQATSVCNLELCDPRPVIA
jgi:hypothetical protein